MNRFDSKVSCALRNEKNMNRSYYYMIGTAVRCSLCVTDET